MGALSLVLKKLNRLIELLTPPAVVQSADKTLKFRTRSLLNFTTFVLGVLIIYSILHFAFHIYVIAWIMLAALVGYVAILFYFYLSANVFIAVNAAYLLGWFVVSVTAYLNSLYNSQALVWYIVIAYTSLQMTSALNAVVWMAIILLTYLGYYVLDMLQIPTIELYSEDFLHHLRYQNYIYILLIGMLVVYIYSKQRDSLLEMLEKKNRDLENKDLELKKQLQNNETLLKIVAHDIGTPVQSIMFNISRIKRAVTELQQNSIEDIEIALSSINDIIRHVRTMQDLNEIDYKVIVDKVDLIRVIKEEIAIYNHKLLEKNISIVLQYQDKINECCIYAEKTSLQNEVIGNLLSNAIKFSGPNSQILIQIECDVERVFLSVKDTGIGMTNGMINSILNSQKQISRVGTSGEKGIGYGMILLSRYLKLYGADLKIMSQSIDEFPNEHGTEFIIGFKGC